MTPRTKSALLWGAVGLLAFLAAVQGYQLLVAPVPVSIPAIGAVAVGVGLLTAGVAYATEHRLRTKGRT
ncbi:hypothetical protein [Halolamina sediminis]|uniref:hypothetical protein n=1 Tax=Halolamina sediminis TaxID=1480675 RepID=UPI0006B65DEC|nr:hypothetical protein [Halolamina sediminis]